MHTRACLITIVVVLMASAAFAQQTQKVVLLGGATIEVSKASVQGGYVHLTYASGQMQAYPVGDVDLAASGLLPAAAAAPDRAGTQRMRTIADATSKATTESSIKITDEDVDHVIQSATDPAGGEADEGEDVVEGASAAALLISNLQKEISGTMVNLTGTVHNSGTKPVTAITLQAKATNSDGELAGSGSTSISKQLEPKDEVGFSISFPAEGRVVDIQVRAAAAVAAFDFAAMPPPAPATESGD